MDLVFRSLRKTVAPPTGLEFASTTYPETTRWPKFWACAAGPKPNLIGPPRDPPETTPVASAASATPASKLVRFSLTLPPRPLQADRRPHPDRRPPAPTPAVLRRPPRTPPHTPRR